MSVRLPILYPFSLDKAQERKPEELVTLGDFCGRTIRVCKAPVEQTDAIHCKKSGAFSNSIWSRSAAGAKRLFISLDEEIAKTDQAKVKKALVVDFDERNQIKSVKEAVKISMLFDGTRSKHYEAIKRRLHIMQALNGLPEYPENYGFFEYAGKHGNTVAIFQEHFECDVHEFFEKKTLNTFSLPHRLQMVEEVISDVFEMHKKGYIHKDLTLGNLLYKVGHVKLSDFGFSCRRDDHASTNQRAGTFPWMAPELLSPMSIQIDESVDVWSLSLIIYILIYGDLPNCMSHLVNMVELDRQIKDAHEERQRLVMQYPGIDSFSIVEWISNCLWDPPQERVEAKRRFYKLSANIVRDSAAKSFAYSNWCTAVNGLPERPSEICTIDDLIHAMRQKDPRARIGLQQALEAVREIRKKHVDNVPTK